MLNKVKSVMNSPRVYEERVMEREVWMRALESDPLISRERIRVLARNAARADRSDPFTFNRTYSRLLSGVAVPADYEKGK